MATQGERLEAHDLDDLDALARPAGLQPVLREVLRRNRPDPALYLGSGAAERIADQLRTERIGLVLFDHAISAIQQRNLERLWKVQVADRTELIIEIFSQRARSTEGKLQVELARMQHQASRLVRMWSHLERQRGGIGVRGGRLTRAGALAADQLFATLDPLTRRLGLGNGLEVVLSDTVGFIRNLPHGLVAAFRATLEETAEADLLLHVVDAGSPDRERQIEAVNQVIAEIGAGEVEQLMIYNKIDLTGNVPEVRLDPYGRITGLALSAGTGAGVDALRDLLRERAQARAQAVDETAWYGDEAFAADVSDPSDVSDDADPSADEDGSDHPSS